MYLFCLIYPSETLAEIYHPIDFLNEGCSLTEVRDRISNKIKSILKPIKRRFEHDSNREDKRWYYMAPLLMDGDEYAFDLV